jgi:hypothetical protein
LQERGTLLHLLDKLLDLLLNKVLNLRGQLCNLGSDVLTALVDILGCDFEVLFELCLSRKLDLDSLLLLACDLVATFLDDGAIVADAATVPGEDLLERVSRCMR